MRGDEPHDLSPFDAYDQIYDRFSSAARRLAFPVNDEHLVLAAWIGLEEILAHLPEGQQTGRGPAILRPELPRATPENIELALAIAATQCVRLSPPDDAPDAIRHAYRVAEALLDAIRAETVVH